MKINNEKSILIIRGGGIGDLLLIIPTLIQIRNYFKGYKITLLTNFRSNGTSSPVNVLLKFGLLDDVISINFKSRNKLILLIDILKSVLRNRGNFNISVCLRHSNRSFLSKFIDFVFFKKIIDAKIGFGFWNSSDLSFKYDKHNNMFHMIKEPIRLSNILKSEGLDLPKLNYRNFVLNQVKRITFSKSISLPKDFVILCPFGNPFINRFNKNWSIENYIFISKYIISQGLKIVIVGSQKEFESASKIQKSLGPMAINFCGKCNILELFKVSYLSKFYLGNDTGPMHISALVGTKVVAIFSSNNNKNKFYPLGDNHLIFQNFKSIKMIKKDYVLNSMKINKII